MTKEELRKKMFQMRLELSEDEIYFHSLKITNKLVRKKTYKEAKSIAVYLDINNEVKTSFLINHAWSEGKDVYIPFINNKEMSFFLLSPWDEITYNDIIEYPKYDFSNSFDLMIYPCIAITDNKKRIGYGTGFYDNYTGNAKNKYAFCYDFQINHKVSDTRNEDLQIKNIITN